MFLKNHTKYRTIKKLILIFFICASLLFSNFYIFPYISYASDEEPNVSAKGAILIEKNTGKILYRKNMNIKMFPASTTKILTAIIIIENCNLDEKVIVTKEPIALIPEGYSISYLQEGEELTIKQLLQMLLIHSANDAANVLAFHYSGSIENFAKKMNEKIKELNLENTHFTNPSGMHDDNHYTTAYDMALLMKYCIQNDTFKEITNTVSCTIPATNKSLERIFTNSNLLINPAYSNYYLPYVLYGKTGFTSQAQNCLVSVSKKDNLELICVVFHSEESSSGNGRFLDSKILFEYGYNNYSLNLIAKKGDVIKNVIISNGTKNSQYLPLVLENDIIALQSKNSANKVYPNITVNGDLYAPIQENSIVGKVEYIIDNLSYSSNLLAEHSVEPSFFSNNLFCFGLIPCILEMFSII